MTFEYMEVSFVRFDPSTGEVDEQNFKVKDYEELDELQDRFPEHRMQKVGYVKCDCGRLVGCYSFTNTCICGTDYNSFGQRLAPREQWGEETGESLSDIFFEPDDW